jgi:hypothetical protein
MKKFFVGAALVATALFGTTACDTGQAGGKNHAQKIVAQQDKQQTNKQATTSGSTPSKKPAAPKYTGSQEQAIGSASDYLNTQAFSRSGLIGQLKYEKFSVADATFAVDHITVNWMKQAEASAKEYLDGQSFSRDGLIGQLKYEGFTQFQAVYGVNHAGL